MSIKVDPRVARAQKEKSELEKKYGVYAGATGRSTHKQGAVPTGSLAWDYASGVGGWLFGESAEVFGSPSIGKTTIAIFNYLRNAQSMGMLTGVIATEPNVKEDWMEKHGINLDHNLIARPDNGEEAFGILHDWVYNKGVDAIAFDSIGGISSAKEQDADKPQAFGNAALIAWGVKRVVARAWKHEIPILYVNQQRDDNKSRIAGLVESPGGWAFKHAMTTRVHLKPGKDQYKIKMDDGEEKKDVTVGRQVIANYKKNKGAEANGRSARFDFFHIDTDGDYPFGFDVAKDVFTAAKMAGIFGSGTWLEHPIFPNGKINGKEKAKEFIGEHPEVVPEIREEVLAVMRKEEAKKEEAKQRAKSAAARKQIVPPGKTK